MFSARLDLSQPLVAAPVVGITQSRHKLDFVFELFQKFAEHPSEEICPRFFWSERKGCHPDFYEADKYYLNITRCGVTTDVLMSSIFGIGDLRKVQRILYTTENEDDLRKAWLQIETNAQLLTKTASTTFFAYLFAIDHKDSFPGHGFIVIQYLDEQEIRYRIFQSYIGKFCLKEYLKKNNNTIDSDEFKIFLTGLQECLLSDKWTNELELFYTKYFNLERAFAVSVGKANPCKRQFILEWGAGTIEEVLLQIKEFESFKKFPSFPKFEAMGCCEEPIVRPVEDSAEVLAEKMRHFEEMDKKLRDTYEKNEPLTGKEPIQVDLNSLNLDLAEEGLLDVPARDEKGNLIMDGEDVKWIERVVTLKKAAQDVIAELNDLIQHNFDCTPTKSHRTLVINTNKQPFHTYQKLGVPLDQFYLSKEEAKLLWLHRIIDALVDKGHLSKLDSVNGHGYFVHLPRK